MTIGFITSKGGEGKSMISRMFCTFINYDAVEIPIILIDADVQDSQGTKRQSDLLRIQNKFYGERHWLTRKLQQLLDKDGRLYDIIRIPEPKSGQGNNRAFADLVTALDFYDTHKQDALIVVDVAGNALSDNFQAVKPHLDYLFIPVSLGEDARNVFHSNLELIYETRETYRRLKGVYAFFNRYQKNRAVHFEKLREQVLAEEAARQLGIEFLENHIVETSILNNSSLVSSLVINACNTLVPHTSYYDLGIDRFALEVMEKSYFKQYQLQ
ncbi:hypothetical protein V9K67_21485 [Paraflavisolibacter sp. H34]|uniref:hypothetical protein n=1 Tax=Huijunlia imazamoxiresistens TaxID=3127457 RepID=UPI003015B932